MRVLLVRVVRALGRIHKLGLRYAALQVIFAIYDVSFDFWFGVDTRGRISIEKLGVDDTRHWDSRGYQAAHVLSVRRVFRNISFSPADILIDIYRVWQGTDIGSGIGNTMWLCAGNRDVVGSV